MQDFHPEVVTPEELVSEITIRRSNEVLTLTSPPSSPSSLPKPMSIDIDIDEEEEEEEGEGEEGLSLSGTEIVLLDCQNPPEYQEWHIKGALNITFPAIMIRRIAAGKIDIFEKSNELKAKIANAKITFVIYGGEQESDLVGLIAKKLAQNGCRVATLKGGLSLFRELYPEFVESEKKSSTEASSSSSAEPSPECSRICHGVRAEVPLLGLGSLASLKIQDDPDNNCDSCIGLDPDDAFPVEIIPNLYLGNASISSDFSVLEKHNIKHILNVTPDLPNVFEGRIRYLQIPISDHWTQSMLKYFVPAIQFIDEGRSKEEGVLVHCLAGISRSVTITMAYLMYKMNLSLNEAYDIVRAKKANISPNFHFMGQLLDFERQLHSQFLSPPALGSSPDSGIEFDRWQSN